MDDHMMTGGKMKCSCFHHKIVPALIIFIGALFLLNAIELLPENLLNILWPLMLILVGITKIFSGNCGCCSAMH